MSVVEQARLYAGAGLVLPMVRNLDGRLMAERTPAERMQIYSNLVARIDRTIVALDQPPGFTARDVLDLGVSIVVMPLASLDAATSALIGCYEDIYRNGTAFRHFKDNPKELPAIL